MHICVLTIDYPSPGHPVYTFVEQLCIELARKGCKISVVAPQNLVSIITGKRHKVDFVRTYNYGKGMIQVYSPYTVTGYSVPYIGKWINKWAGYITRMYMRHWKLNPDVFYSHFWHSGLWTYHEAKRLGKPYFVASGEASIVIKNNTKEINDYCSYVKGVICVSTKNKVESVNKGLTTEGKCVVIPNAIDNSLFYSKDKFSLRKKLGYNPDDFIIAFVGYLCERKGSKRLSDAIKQINDPTIKTMFIGAPDGASGIPDCQGIIFRGTVKHDELPDYMNCADVFVLPTLQEGCCNSIIEAMACGLPIISSNRDFNYDILDDTCSILIDPLNIDAISDAIKMLRDNRALREQLSRGALAKAKNLTIDKRADRIISFISEHK